MAFSLHVHVCFLHRAPERNLGDTHIIHRQLSLETIQERAESALSAEGRGESPPPPQPHGRPVTPLEPSPRGPLQSSLGRGGVAYGGRGGCGSRGGVRGSRHRSEMELLNESAMDSKYQLMHAEDKSVHVQRT